MIRPALLVILPLLTVACAPLIELEDENIALRSRVDSLEIVLAECHGQGELLGDRLAAIEAQNIALDDRNRELTALLAETRFDGERTPPANAPGDARSPIASSTGGAAPDEATPDEATSEGATPGGESTGPESSDSDVSVLSDAKPVSTTGTLAPEHDTGRIPGGNGAVAAVFVAGRPAGLAFLRRYQEALSAYNDKRYAESATMFAALLSEEERNEMIDNCHFWLGEAEAQRGHSAEAVTHFTRAIACSGGDKVDDALFSRATVRRATGSRADARDDLRRLLREFPQSELAGQARSVLRGLE